MHLSAHYKRLRLRRLKVAVLAVVISLFFIPVFKGYVKPENNMFRVSINGNYVGTLASEEEARHCYLEARKHINAQTDSLTFIDTDMTFEASAVDFGKVDNDTSVIANIENIMRGAVISDLYNAYEVN